MSTMLCILIIDVSDRPINALSDSASLLTLDAADEIMYFSSLLSIGCSLVADAVVVCDEGPSKSQIRWGLG